MNSALNPTITEAYKKGTYDLNVPIKTNLDLDALNPINIKSNV